MKCLSPNRLALCLALCSLAGTARADFLTPDTAIAGKSQTSLSAAWWQWAFSYPASTTPLLDPDGTHSAAGSQGNVFFLAGFAGANNQGVVGVADRTVTVSSSQTLFFPVLNALGATPDGIPPAALPLAVATFLGTPDNLFATLTNLGTGQTWSLGFNDLFAHRQATGLFNVTFGPDNIYGAAPGTYPAVSDGYWLGIGPLAPGTYELKFGGHSLGHLPNDFGYDGSPIDNTQDITYQITVKTPEPSAFVLAAMGLLVPLYRRYRRPAPP